jgi:hypothetical protein
MDLNKTNTKKENRGKKSDRGAGIHASAVVQMSKQCSRGSEVAGLKLAAAKITRLRAALFGILLGHGS